MMTEKQEPQSIEVNKFIARNNFQIVKPTNNLKISTYLN
jgi:hypothetical protein